MPSYVLAAQEIAPTTNKKNATNVIKTDSTSITVHHYNSNTNQVISPQRNLSLNLSPQYVDVQQSEQQQQKQQQQKQQLRQQQLGQKAIRSNKQLKAPLIKSTPITTTDAKFNKTTTTAATKKMLANVSNNLVGAIGSDDAYSERALLLRGVENVAGSNATVTTTTTTTMHNNNQNSFHLRTIPKTLAVAAATTTTTTTTKIAHNNNNNNNNNMRNNYGSTLITRNIVDGGGGGQGDGGADIHDVDYLQTADDDMLSADVAHPTTNTGTLAVSVNDNNEQKNYQYQTRQNITTTAAANKKTKMSKLGSKNVGLKR